MATERKIVHRGTFAAEIEDFDLNGSLIESVRNDSRAQIPWDREHHGYISTWDMAYSCSSGSNVRDGDPCFRK